MDTNTQLDAWMGQEIDVELHEPGPDNPRYTALIEEFAVMGEGNTLDDAITALFANLQSYVESFVKAEQPLPPRMPGISPGDERADQMNGR